jgi:hypothetical protein
MPSPSVSRVVSTVVVVGDDVVGELVVGVVVAVGSPVEVAEVVLVTSPVSTSDCL